MVFNKKIVLTASIIIFVLLVAVTLWAIMLNKSWDRNKVVIIEKESIFHDFYVENDKVYIECELTIKNTYNKQIEVEISANMEEDMENGLLIENIIPGYLKQTSTRTLTLKPNSKDSFDVTFIGNFGGNNQKLNRMIPEIIIDEFN